MQVLKYMDYNTFVDTFGTIYHRYRMTNNSTYAYYSVYPVEYIQVIQQLVWDDYTITMCFFRYIDRMIEKGKISEIEHRKIMNHAYFIFTGDLRHHIANENEFDDIFRNIDVLIDNMDSH